MKVKKKIKEYKVSSDELKELIPDLDCFFTYEEGILALIDETVIPKIDAKMPKIEEVPQNVKIVRFEVGLS